MSARPAPFRRDALLEQLRAQVTRLERGACSRATLPLCPTIDAWLPAGGLARGAVHEVLAADEGAAMGFCAFVLGQLGGTVTWIGAKPDAAPQGLHRFGLEPAGMLFVAATEAADALWATEEALRCSVVAGALLIAPPLSLTAARRLQLAAEAGGGLGLLLRPDDGAVSPTTALTRWRVAAAGAVPGTTSALDRLPSWRLELLRSRGGRTGKWQVRWDVVARHLVVEE